MLAIIDGETRVMEEGGSFEEEALIGIDPFEEAEFFGGVEYVEGVVKTVVGQIGSQTLVQKVENESLASVIVHVARTLSRSSGPAR